MRHPRWSRLRRVAAAAAFLGVLSIGAPADADARHNPRRSGHPLRFIAYVLHPVGYVLDTVLVRPLHWVVSRDGLDEVFGHTDR